MNNHLLGAACISMAVYSASGNAALISSQSFGSVDSVSGTLTTLSDMLPGRFRIVYGDLLVCEEGDCSFYNANPNPPDAVLFDIAISESMSQSFILDSGADFDTAVALATNGAPDPMNFMLEYEDGQAGYGLEWEEDSLYSAAVDLAGYDIWYFELIMNVVIAAPGRDPNGDGVWVDRNEYWTFNVYGAPTAIPVPAAVYLFGSGLIGLLGFARKRSV